MKSRNYESSELVRVMHPFMYGARVPRSLLFDVKDYVDNAKTIDVKPDDEIDEWVKMKVLRGSLLSHLMIGYSSKYSYEYTMLEKMGKKCGERFKHTGQRLFQIKTGNDFFNNMLWNVEKKAKDEFCHGFESVTGRYDDQYHSPVFFIDRRPDDDGIITLTVLYVGFVNNDIARACLQLFNVLMDDVYDE